MKYMITDIQWDTDDDEEILATLPKSIELKGDEFPEEAYEDEESLSEYVSDWLTDTLGLCHFGFNNDSA
mgnify:CR=1 FL=1